MTTASQSASDIPKSRHPSIAVLRVSIRPSAITATIIGVICAALAAEVSVALEKVGYALPGVPASTPASLVWVVLVTVLLGTPYLVLRKVLRFENKFLVEPAPDTRPGVRIHPAWWVQLLGAWAASGIAFYVCSWALAITQHVQLRGWHGVPGEVHGAPDLGPTSMIALGGAIVWAAMTGIAWLVKAAGLRQVRSAWIVISFLMSFFFGGLYCALLAFVTLAVDWASVRAGLGSVWTMATALGFIPLAIAVSEICGRGFFWEYHGWPSPVRPRGWNPADIRTWDLDAETSHSGMGGNGYPYFIWRESADNRLGLSRPRFCTIMEEDDRLMFVFYDPVALTHPKRWPLLTVLLAIGIAFAMLVSDALLPAIFGRAPVFTDGRTHPLALLVYVGLVAVIWASILTSLAYIGVMLTRWYWDRFEADGLFSTMPLRELSGFQAAPADRLLAKGEPEIVRTGEGLTAVFSDGSVWILTSNAWQPKTVGDYHKELTNAFRTPRDDMLAAFAARLKRSAQAQRGGTSHGVPDQL